MTQDCWLETDALGAVIWFTFPRGVMSMCQCKWKIKIWVAECPFPSVHGGKYMAAVEELIWMIPRYFNVFACYFVWCSYWISDFWRLFGAASKIFTFLSMHLGFWNVFWLEVRLTWQLSYERGFGDCCCCCLCLYVGFFGNSYCLWCVIDYLNPWTSSWVLTIQPCVLRARKEKIQSALHLLTTLAMNQRLGWTRLSDQTWGSDSVM